MKLKYAFFAALVLLVAFGAGVAGETEFHNCGVCKAMAEQPGLMEHVKWEAHPIATGMIAVTTVDPDYEKAFATVHEKMMQAVARLEAGEQMELCPMCKGMGQLAEAGAQFENIDSTSAHILAVTSAKPEVVTKIHDHVRMTNEMMAGHEDHGHGG